MTDASNHRHPLSQLDKFKALARELEADEDEARWDERLAKVVAHRPAPALEPDQDKGL